MDKQLLDKTFCQLISSGQKHAVIRGHFQGRSFQASLCEIPHGYQIQINGYSYRIKTVQSHHNQDLFQALESEVLAPMEGLVIDVLVKPAQQVSKGQTLLHLESMKLMMEIKAPFDSTIVAINIASNQKVEANQKLFELEQVGELL